MKKTIFLVIIFSVLLGVLFWQFSPKIWQKNDPQKEEVNLVYWGMEDEELMRPAIAAFKNSHPKINITYKKQSLLNYRTRLQTQLQAGGGVDIFEVHSSLIPLIKDNLSLLPSSFMGSNEYKQTFSPVSQEKLILEGKIYALPRETEGLALFYNEEILRGVGAYVPTNWQQLLETSKKVTVKNQEGQIQTAGVALGTSTNVDFWPEILGMLFFQQPAGNLENPAGRDGVEVLQFYTSFITDPRSKTWDITLPSSGEMFARGKLAFYFAPASQVDILKQKNPNLSFKATPVPALSGKPVSYSSFWAVGVAGGSSNQKEAWEFVKFLYSNQNQILGKIPARLDWAAELAGDPTLGTFITQVPYYKSWYLNSFTQDAGINEEMISVYKTAIDSVLGGQDSNLALQTATPKIQQILEKYKVK